MKLMTLLISIVTLPQLSECRIDVAILLIQGLHRIIQKMYRANNDLIKY